MKHIIAVIGDKFIEKNSLKYKLAFETGKLLAENGFRIQSGGLQGVMQAVFEGAHSAANYEDGTTIALVPSFNPNDANPYADIVIPTGLDILRNGLVADASAVIVIGGGAGTLSETAFAWSLYRLIIAYDNVDGWGKKLAGTKLDSSVRCEGEDMIYPAQSAEQAIKILKENLDRYTRYHIAIRPDGVSN